jgi:hypothetical protein
MIVHFQGDDPEAGPLLRYTIVQPAKLTARSGSFFGNPDPPSGYSIYSRRLKCNRAVDLALVVRTDRRASTSNQLESANEQRQIGPS